MRHLANRVQRVFHGRVSGRVLDLDDESVAPRLSRRARLELAEVELVFRERTEEPVERTRRVPNRGEKNGSGAGPLGELDGTARDGDEPRLVVWSIFDIRREDLETVVRRRNATRKRSALWISCTRNVHRRAGSVVRRARLEMRMALEESAALRQSDGVAFHPAKPGKRCPGSSEYAVMDADDRLAHRDDVLARRERVVASDNTARERVLDGEHSGIDLTPLDTPSHIDALSHWHR
jgi:hypothetical protein